MSRKDDKIVTILSRTIESGTWPDINSFIQDMMRLNIKVKINIEVPFIEEQSDETPAS